MGEKAMNQLVLLSQPSYGQVQFQVQLLQVHTREITHFYIFQMMPSALVPRTQIWCVTRQCFYMQRLGCAAREVFGDSAPTMNRRTIPNHQQAFSGLAPQMLQKHHGVLTRKRFRTNQRVHLPRWSKTGHDGQMISGQPLVNHRRLAFWSVGLDHPRHQIEARFVHKNQGAALPDGLLPQHRPNRLTPALNRCLVTLDRPGNGNLRRPAQILHQPRNVVLVIGDAQFPLDHLRDAGTGPNVSAKPISLRSVPKEIREPGQLFCSKFRRTTGGWMAMQSFRSTFFHNRKPPAYSPLANPKGHGNIDFQPAQFVQLERLEPSPFSYSPIKVLIIHPFMVTNVALFAQLSVIWQRCRSSTASITSSRVIGQTGMRARDCSSTTASSCAMFNLAFDVAT